MKILKRLVIGVVVLLLAAIALLWTPDTDRSAMLAKYGGSPSQFLNTAGGQQIHYRDQGARDAPALVFIHGTSASLHTWEPLIAELGGEFRMVSLDLPAHGLTGTTVDRDYSHQAMVEAVWAVMRLLNIDSATLVGNSLGGAIAWKAALDSPQKVKSLVLLAPAGVPKKTQSPSNIGFKLLGTKLGRVAMRKITPRSIIKKSLQQTIEQDELVDEAMVDRYWELLRLPGNRQAMIDLATTPRNRSALRNLKTINQPSLIIWGDKDGLLPVDMAATFAQELPNNSLVVLKDIGHLPMEEAVLDTAREIREFCAKQGC